MAPAAKSLFVRLPSIHVAVVIGAWSMGMIQEFKEFAMKGNVVDMAVGIVIGGAFGTVVKSLVDNVLMPPIGFLAGQVDFASLSLKIPVPGGSAPVEIRYGLFINAIISFLIMAFALFLIVKWMNRMRSQIGMAKQSPPPSTKKCPECQMDIPITARRCAHCTSQVAV
jgi:large conductance mechanosensitive channel